MVTPSDVVTPIEGYPLNWKGDLAAKGVDIRPPKQQFAYLRTPTGRSQTTMQQRVSTLLLGRHCPYSLSIHTASTAFILYPGPLSTPPTILPLCASLPLLNGRRRCYRRVCMGAFSLLPLPTFRAVDATLLRISDVVGRCSSNRCGCYRYLEISIAPRKRRILGRQVLYIGA